MTAWALAHPWLAFSLAGVALILAYDVAVTAVQRRRR